MCFLGLEAGAQARISAEPIVFDGQTDVEISIRGALRNMVLTVEVSNVPHMRNQSVQITTNAQGSGRGRISYSVSNSNPRSRDWCNLTPEERSQTGVLVAFSEGNHALYRGTLAIYYLYTHQSLNCDQALLVRLRNGGNHLFTTDFLEVSKAKNNHGYVNEGIVCTVFGNQIPGTIPFYRLRKGGSYFYTTDVEERDNALRTLGYVSEGIACYVYNSQMPGTTPFYRLRKGGSHFYTIYTEEREDALRIHGYVNEGIACFVFP